MTHMDNALYSPYGAFELKAKYQRNFLLGTGLTLGAVLLLLVISWLVAAVQKEEVVAGAPVVIKTVADDEVIDDDVVLATREELAEIVAPDIAATTEGGGDVVVDIQEEEYLPAMDEFVPVEISAEMIYKEEPEYPRLAEQAGLTGTVWVKALVSRDGTVKDAAVFRTSGTASLDEAAVKSAYKCRYKPAIQNGRPVAMWVTYRVEFEL
jgi:TonB family protein